MAEPEAPSNSRTGVGARVAVRQTWQERLARRDERYRGPDRRPQLVDGTDARSWTGAGLGLVGLSTTVTLLAIDAGIREALLPFTSYLRVAALVLTVVFAAAAVGLWRVTGEVRGCRVATAAWALTGVVTLDLAGPVEGSAPWLLRVALGAVAAGWLLWAAAGPDVDTRVRAGRDVLLAAAATGMLWGALLVLVALPGPGQDATVPVVRILGVAWWTVVAVGIVVRSAGVRSYLLGWVQWAAAGIAVAEVARYLEATGNVGLAFPSSAVRLGAIILAAVGTVTSLAAAATGRRGELYREVQRQRRVQEEQRSEAAERDHEVRNALLAIEGATLTLQRHRENLTQEIQEELTSTVVNQLAELREMMVGGPQAPTGGENVTADVRAGGEDARVLGGPRSTPTGGSCGNGVRVLRLADVVREQVRLARARDLAVELQLASLTSSEVRGDRTLVSRAVDNLLRNAEVHGAGHLGSRIDVEVRNEGDQVVLSVRDHGLGVPVGDEESIFRRGVQLSSAASGEGLGLHIARRTMRELGGDLRHEHPAGGGARFVATFPPAVPRGAAGWRGAETPEVSGRGGVD